MTQKGYRAKAGFEGIIEQAKVLIVQNEEAMNAEISQAIEPIKAKFAENLAGYEKIIADYSEEFEIEVPDEVQAEEVQAEEVAVENDENFRQE